MTTSVYFATRLARRLIDEGFGEDEAIAAAAFTHNVSAGLVERYTRLALAACEHARRAQAEAAERTAELHDRRERQVEAAR